MDGSPLKNEGASHPLQQLATRTIEDEFFISTLEEKDFQVQAAADIEDKDIFSLGSRSMKALTENQDRQHLDSIANTLQSFVHLWCKNIFTRRSQKHGFRTRTH